MLTLGKGYTKRRHQRLEKVYEEIILKHHPSVKLFLMENVSAIFFENNLISTFLENNFVAEMSSIF